MKTRVSAYGLVIADERVLLTQLADFCYRPRHWTLPGGGMQHGELPEETLVREFYEETSLEARDLDLFHVHTFSESERGPFMGVQIVYRVSAEGEPSVIEVGGSTADVAWVSFADLQKLDRVPGLDVILKKLGVLPSSS
ncbi:MAG: 8-oxo-dGTP diphosphatase [Polyangiales bacterium]|jgi:8-oxo-dGTP diphosphatase